MAAGIDQLRGGRVEFGIGAGWKEIEYAAYGFPFPPAPQRVDELVDTIEICIRMWTEDKASYGGKRYSIADALCAPKPAQTPFPIWIGGSKPRVLRIAAKYAHWMNHTAGDMTPAGRGGGQGAPDSARPRKKPQPKTPQRPPFLSGIGCA